MKQYKITFNYGLMTAFGVADSNAFQQKLLHWLLGMAFGLEFSQSKTVFNVCHFNGRQIVFETNNDSLCMRVQSHFAPYGVDISEVS